MSIFEVLASEDAATQERLSGTRAVIAAQTRAKDAFGTFVANAQDETERNARIALVATDLDAILADVANEYGYENVESLRNAATVALGGGHPADCTCGFCENKGSFGKDEDEKEDEKDDDGVDPEAELKAKTARTSSISPREVSDLDWDGIVKTADGFSHCDCDCEGCNEGNHCESEKCIETKHSGNGGNPASAGSSEKNSSTQKLAMAVSKRDFEAIAAILQQNGADPNLAQQIADYFATQNPNFDNDRFMDASGLGQQLPAQVASVLTDAIRVAADASDIAEDSYAQERVDLPSSKDGLGGPSPKIDKSNSGDNLGWDLKPIDVPSDRHPTEKQQIHDTPDYKADLEGASGTGERVDADAAIQPEFNTGDRTDTWTGTEGQASPVTSSVLAKWALA